MSPPIGSPAGVGSGGVRFCGASGLLRKRSMSSLVPVACAEAGGSRQGEHLAQTG